MDDEVEVMRVLRVSPRGRLVIEVDGRRYKALREVANLATRRRLSAAIGELIVFADGYDSLVEAGVAPPLATKPSDASQPYAPTIEERRAAFLAELERQRDAALQDAAAAAGTQPPTAAAIGATGPLGQASIVEQLNVFLQKHVAANPKLAGRSVHLVPVPAGGLRIEVDGRNYKEPGEIQDEEIRKVISAALKEWETS